MDKPMFCIVPKGERSQSLGADCEGCPEMAIDENWPNAEQKWLGCKCSTRRKAFMDKHGLKTQAQLREYLEVNDDKEKI